MKSIVHWNKQKKTWSFHTYKGCEWAPVILIDGSWRTECRPEKPGNPKGWVVSQKEFSILNPSPEILSQYKKTGRLIYDKQQVTFNASEGKTLLFDTEGCHILEKI